MMEILAALVIVVSILMVAASGYLLTVVLSDFFAMRARNAQIRSMTEELDRGVSYERNLELTAIVNRMLAE
jgi:cell division protein FtsI/penicillin-binding protein 2